MWSTASFCIILFIENGTFPCIWSNELVKHRYCKDCVWSSSLPLVFSVVLCMKMLVAARKGDIRGLVLNVFTSCSTSNSSSSGAKFNSRADYTESITRPISSCREKMYSGAISTFSFLVYNFGPCNYVTHEIILHKYTHPAVEYSSKRWKRSRSTQMLILINGSCLHFQL